MTRRAFHAKPSLTHRRSSSARRSTVKKLAAAVNLIHCCTPERFAELTAEDVALHSGLPLARVEQMLADARGRRQCR